jgi:hypothetical protein
MTPVVVGLVTDLMDRSRFGVLAAGGVDVRFVRTAAQLADALGGLDGSTSEQAHRVVVDLARPDALDAVVAAGTAGVEVIAYGSHVERERLDEARSAGAQVLARSAFFARLIDLLS